MVFVKWCAFEGPQSYLSYQRNRDCLEVKGWELWEGWEYWE